MSDFMDYKQQWEAAVAKQTKELDRLKFEHAKMKAALESIACEERPELEKKGYWLTTTHAECAQVLAEDTTIARNMLKELES